MTAAATSIGSVGPSSEKGWYLLQAFAQIGPISHASVYPAAMARNARRLAARLRLDDRSSSWARSHEQVPRCSPADIFAMPPRGLRVAAIEAAADGGARRRSNVYGIPDGSTTALPALVPPKDVCPAQASAASSDERRR
jgi:hypothetical protein